MIAENQYLIPQSVKESYAERGKFLLVVTDLEEKGDDQIDPVIDKINTMKETFDVHLKEIKQNLSDVVNNKIDKLQSDTKKNQDQMTMIKDLIATLMKNNKIKVSCYDKKLGLVTYGLLKAKHSGYARGWFCDGKKQAGCRGGKDRGQKDPEEYRYHCAQCSFDYCEKC